MEEKLKFRLLRADEIEVRIGSMSKEGSGTQWCDLLLYQDARAAMRQLDETVGPMNWKRKHYSIDGRLYCEISIYNPTTQQWVSKEDVGTESSTEKEKGQASDAFKRAAVNWGIGRELYSAPQIRIWGGGKQTKAMVKAIEYNENGDIVKLEIVGKKNAYDRNEAEGLLFQWPVVTKPMNTAAQPQGTGGQQANTSGKPQGTGGKSTYAIPIDLYDRAMRAQSIEDLKALQQKLISKGQWNTVCGNIFNNIVIERKWN